MIILAMAFHTHHTHIGAESTFPALDGVPFVLNERCRPPQKVMLPMKFEAGNPSEFLFFEYDTSLEQMVLRQCQAEREALAAARSRRKSESEAAAAAASSVTAPGSQHHDLPKRVDDSCNNSSMPGQQPDAVSQLMNGGSMLVPTPIPFSSAGSRGELGAATSRNFDPKDFESEQDPFENLSLRVINDREELNKVFRMTATNADQRQSDAPTTPPQLSSSVNAADVPKPQPVDVAASADGRNSALMQYINGGRLATTSGISFVPCQSVTSTAGGGRNSPAGAAIRYPPGYMPPRTTAEVNILKNGDVSYAASALPPSVTSVALLRSARSTPDMTSMCAEGAGAAIGACRTPPPTSSNTKSLTGCNSKNEYQPALASWQQPVFKPVAAPKSEVYLSLTVEARHFVDTIRGMGFDETDVARAVKQLGVDDKQVLDHLCVLGQLRDKGYGSTDAATALFLFDGSLDKAETYLKLVKTFSELGFQRERITNVLISSDLDEEKSLDLLVGTS